MSRDLTLPELERIVEDVLNSKTSLHAVQSAPETRSLRRAFRRAGAFAPLVDRAPVFSKETLLHALYQACQMPASFGFNWDALEDALRDFSWIKASAYVLLFDDYSVLQERAPEVARTFEAIVRDVNAERLEAGRALLTVVVLGRNDSAG